MFRHVRDCCPPVAWGGGFCVGFAVLHILRSKMSTSIVQQLLCSFRTYRWHPPLLLLPQKQSQVQLGEEAGDGIPAAVDGKARKILGIPGLPPHRRSSNTAAAAAGRSGPLPRRTSVRPVQASPSPLPMQHKHHHFAGGGGGSAPPGKAASATGRAEGVATARDAPLFTPVGSTPVPFAEVGGVPPMPVSPSGSDTQAPVAGDVFSSSGDGGGAERGQASRAGGGGRSSSLKSSHSSSQLPPRDGQSRAAARAARLEADKIAALRHFAAEAKAEKHGGGRGGGGRSGGGGGGGSRSRSSSFRGGGGGGSSASGSGSAGPMPWDDGDQASEAGMSDIDPPILPSGELLEEGSKAWRLLGAGGPGPGVRAASVSDLPSALVATSRSAEFDVGVPRSKASPSPSPPPLHPRLTMEDGAAAQRPLSLSLASLDIGAGAVGRVAEQWAANSNTVPTPHGGTTRRADPPLSPGAQTPPPLSPADPDDLTLAVHSSHQQGGVRRFRTPLSARGPRPSQWGATAAEAEAAASVVSPPSWGQASTPSGNGGGRGFSSNSAASTPRSTRSSKMWGNGGGGAKKGEEGGGAGPIMARTPGRLPRRLHQGVNNFKRAVGVG